MDSKAVNAKADPKQQAAAAFERGVALCEEKKWADALEELRRGFDTGFSNYRKAEYYARMSECTLVLMRFDECIKHATDCIQLNTKGVWHMPAFVLIRIIS